MSAKKIAELNDAHRKSGRFVATEGVRALSFDDQVNLYNLVRDFNTFNKGNDPHKEHDFGKVTLSGENYFWKIDYYDKTDSDYGSEDPSNADVTKRIMTIMRADEY